MIKSLKHYEIILTPFQVVKNQSLSNSNNENLILLEGTGSNAIALEFIDYGNGSSLPTYNNSCDMSLEQQDGDLATVREGLNVSGIFYPETDPTNVDGTYQRSIYAQVKTMFYNTYLDPTKMWGIENVDFELSQTKKQLSDLFRLIDIPRSVFGDVILLNSVNVEDNTLDNPFTIIDDGNGNLFAGTNLFSYQQEVGEYTNIFNSNYSSSYCNYYFSILWHFPVPQNSSDSGQFGWISYDLNYYYIYTSDGYWKRIPIVLVNDTSTVVGEVKWLYYDIDYIYISGSINRLALSLFNNI